MALFPAKCVVVPIDFSESSPAAIAAALELVSDPAHVHVLHVVVPSTHFSSQGEWGPLKEGETRDSASRKELADYLHHQQIAGVTEVVRSGEPSFEVADYAKKQNADLVVIPSHRYHGIKRLVLGSVAEHVIGHTECAVLVLRRREAE